MAFWSGWLTVVVIVGAAMIPVFARLRGGTRPSPQGKAMVTHAQLGLAAAGAAFAHTLLAVTALGSPEAIGGGMLAIVPAALAIFVLMAHVGIGLQLREAGLRQRAQKRRLHLGTAVTIVVMVAVHVVALLRGA